MPRSTERRAGRSAPEPGGTLCEQLLATRASFVASGRRLPAAGVARLARTYARGLTEEGYPRGSLVLVAVHDRLQRLAVSLGAWWAGHAVVLVREPDERRRDAAAVDVGAAVQVCDAGDITDVEHLRHRDVPALAWDEFAGAPVPWPPRCRPADRALVVPGGGPGAGDQRHADLATALADPYGTDASSRPARRAGPSDDAGFFRRVGSALRTSATLDVGGWE